MLDQAFEALKTYEWGIDPQVLQPIQDAVVASHSDPAARQDLEKRLSAALAADLPRAAKDVLCRALRTVGTGASVPALAPLLADENLSHMARYALERIPEPEAGQALREALPKVGTKIKIGILASLGTRGEAASIPLLQGALDDPDAAVVQAAARALGAIGTKDAHRALAAGKQGPATKAVIAEALLGIARQQLVAGKKAEAKATYQKIPAIDASPAVKEAVESGLAGCG